MDITLRPATEEEFAGWRARQMADYAAEIAASGSLPPEAAREKAERDTTTALPAGVHTPGQWIFRLLAGEQPVGWLWLGAPPPGGDPAMAWVYSVEVEEQSRGRGYGRAAMLLAEEEARSRGMTSVGLNVHGSNKPALSLYESLGYEVMTQQMRKLV
jgi:ribosomal protein S18 acetylase RimI-like enzyme